MGIQRRSLYGILYQAVIKQGAKDLLVGKKTSVREHGNGLSCSRGLPGEKKDLKLSGTKTYNVSVSIFTEDVRM